MPDAAGNIKGAFISAEAWEKVFGQKDICPCPLGSGKVEHCNCVLKRENKDKKGCSPCHCSHCSDCSVSSEESTS